MKINSGSVGTIGSARSERRTSGPLKVVQSRRESSRRSETSISKRNSIGGEDILSVTSVSHQSIVEQCVLSEELTFDGNETSSHHDTDRIMDGNGKRNMSQLKRY